MVRYLIDFSKTFYGLKGLKPKNKGHANFYECCDVTEKVYLMYLLVAIQCQFAKNKFFRPCATVKSLSIPTA